ncbi:MAG: TonB-dependent receptor [Bacteroidota bacterium]
MKLVAILLLAGSIQVSAKGYSQLITVSGENISLEKVFEKIEHQTQYVFFYDEDILQRARPLSLDIKHASLAQVLDQCFKDEPLRYHIVGKTIVVNNIEPTPEEKVIAADPIVLIEIKGNVKDDTGKPLEGATILVRGTNDGTKSDANGNFSINAEPNSTLIISYVGFETTEVKVGNRSAILVQLKFSLANAGEQIVVVGYGTQKKKDITGSVTVVDMKALKSIPAGSAEQALQGQASGVNIISSGVPGAQSNIFIRGVTSFGNTQPLVIVDGVQAELNDINTEDIESMQVLKDAGAASIYGVRGSNGVIVITTKKGKIGQPMITYDAYYGTQRPLKANPFNLMNPTDFARLTKEIDPSTALFANGVPDYVYAGPSGSGIANAGDPAVDPSLYNLDVKNPNNNYIIQKVNKEGTDWYRENFKPAPMQSHVVTTSGGTEKSSYLFAFGYLDQQGTLTETYLKRYSARINTQFNVKKNIRIGENAYVFYKDNPAFELADASGGNPVSMSYRSYSMIPVYDIKGNFGGTFGGPDLGSSRNPVAVQKRTTNNKNNYWDVVGNIFVEADFLKHFVARSSIGGTIDYEYFLAFKPTPYNDGEGNTAPNSLSENSLYNSNTIWTNTVTYNNQFGKHNLKVLAGSEAIQNYGRNVGGHSTTLFSDDPNYYNLGNGTQGITTFSTAYVNTLFSLFGRVDYSYDDKYLLAVTVRRDGSSVFGSEKRYGVFPSVSGGWRISRENFMKTVKWVSDLRVRASYGVLGSQNNVSPSNAFTLFGSNPGVSYYDIGGTTNTSVQGFYQITNGNPRTGWEENIVSNYGLDATLFKSKVDFSLDFYKKSIKGLLFPLPLPATTGGAQPPVVNIGDIQNKGVDISIGYRDRLSNNLQFSARANITTYKNKIVDIPGSGYFDLLESRNGTLVRNQKGQEVSSFFGYQVIGLFKDDADVTKSPTQDEAEPGRFKYKDANGDGQITPEDRVFFGNPNPDFTYGLNLGLTYKNFDLGAMFFGSQGNEVLNNTRWFTDFFGSFPAQKNKRLLDAWTPQNTNSGIPKVEAAGSFSTNGVPNSYYMEDGSFLRLRSLVLGYTFNPALIRKAGMNGLRVYVQAVNLFTITKYSGLDPELTGSAASFGVDFGNFPNSQRNFLAGVKLIF